MSQWTRDWGPISVDDDGKNKFISFKYRETESSADSVDLVAKHLNRKHQRASLSISENRELSFTFEGGNFMTDGKDCIMSDKPVRDALTNIHKDSIQSQLSQVSKDNLTQKYDTIIAQLLSSEEARTVADSIGVYFKKNMGCERVIITEKAPHEETNHIDIWAKFIAEKTVLVHYIPEKRYQEVAPSLSSKRREKLTQVKQFLDYQIKNMESFGYKVIPVKMPIPLQANISVYYGDTESKVVDELFWLSYLNSLFVVSDNSKVAYIPQYVNPLNSTIEFSNPNEKVYADTYLFQSYEKEFSNSLEAYGFKSVFLNSDSLLGTAGAIHCVTMQIP